MLYREPHSLKRPIAMPFDVYEFVMENSTGSYRNTRGLMYRVLMDAYMSYVKDPSSFDRSKLVDHTISETKTFRMSFGTKRPCKHVRMRLRDNTITTWIVCWTIVPRAMHVYLKDAAVIDLHAPVHIVIGWVTEQFFRKWSIDALVDRYRRSKDLFELAGIGGRFDGHTGLYQLIGRDIT